MGNCIFETGVKFIIYHANEPLVFLLEPSQIFQLIRSHAIVFIARAIVRLFCGAVLTNNINTRLSLPNQNLNLCKRRYNLCGFLSLDPIFDTSLET